MEQDRAPDVGATGDGLRPAERGRTSHLGAAARALGSAGSVSSVMRALVEALTPDLCDACEVALVESDGALTRVASGPGRAAAREVAPVPDVEWHPLRLALAGEIQVLDAADPVQAAAFGPQDEPLSARALGARRAIVVPMCGRTSVVGVLATAMGRSGRPWGHDDVELVTTIADLGGLAIENLRALQHHRRVVHRFRRAVTVGAALSSVDGVEDIANVLVSVARDELGAATGLVYLREGDVLRLAAAAGYEPEQLDGWRTMDLTTSAPAADVCRTGAPVVLSSMEEVVERYPYVSEVPAFADHAVLTVPLRADGEVLGAAFWAFDRPRRFDDEDRAFVDLVVEQGATALERAQSQHARRLAERQLLSQAEELAASRAQLAALAEADVIGIITGEAERITSANRAFLNMLGLRADGEPLHWPSLTPPEWADQDRAVVQQMLATGRAEPFEKEYFHVEGSRVPVLVGGTTLSTSPFRWIVFVADLTARRRAEQAAEEARSRLEVLLERERHIASTLQASLLPASLPDIPGIELCAMYRPSGAGLDVGGDFYDVFPVDAGRWGVLVGDVCGKGVEAAAVTAAARHTVRAAALHVDDPAEVLRWVHDAIAASPDATFCTLAFGVIDMREAVTRFTVSLGGHEPPLLVGRDGTTKDLGRYGTLLGVVEPEVHSQGVELVAGDLVAMFTDGITDAPAGERLERSELTALLRRMGPAPLDTFPDVLDRELHRRRPHGSRDDVALVLIRIREADDSE